MTFTSGPVSSFLQLSFSVLKYESSTDSCHCKPNTPTNFILGNTHMLFRNRGQSSKHVIIKGVLFLIVIHDLCAYWKIFVFSTSVMTCVGVKFWVATGKGK